jgi:mannose-1-phosphate guanylyltransferase
MHYPDFVLIMAGGVNASFWPLSNKGYPRQFLDILGTGETMLQQTFSRFSKMVPVEKIHVITFRNYVSIVEAQLPDLPRANIIGEPLSKNTAPCIVYACFKLMKKNPGATLLVSPADHQIENEDEFQKVCRKGTEFILRNNALLTLGMKPTYPSTGYGYVQKHPQEFEPNVYQVKQYIEKPYLELAKNFIKNDNYLWNSGIFIWKIKDVIKACEDFLPALFALFTGVLHVMDTQDEYIYLDKVYAACQDISIDFGIMEKATNVFIIPAFFKWCDLGTWGNAWEHMEKDYLSNAISSNNVVVIDSSGCVIHTSPDKIVVIEGLNDYIVADTIDGLLICRKENEKAVKNILSDIKRMEEN